MSLRLAAVLAAGLVLAACDPAPDQRAIVVGSKNFTEGVVLGQLARALASTETPAEHRQALGGTRILFNALVSGEIDVYAEYTGTLTHEILAQQKPESLEEIRELLAESRLLMSGDPAPRVVLTFRRTSVSTRAAQPIHRGRQTP